MCAWLWTLDLAVTIGVPQHLPKLGRLLYLGLPKPLHPNTCCDQKDEWELPCTSLGTVREKAPLRQTRRSEFGRGVRKADSVAR
jgi:hypothetical protein